jgi:drug/metabolite transporter (DMT)-like permease
LAAAFSAVYVVWGSTYLAIRFAIETLPPFIMAGSRFILAGGLLYGWARIRGAPKPSRTQWRSATVIGTLLLLCGNGGVVWAEQMVPSGLTALLVAVVPIWMVLLEWASPQGAAPTPAVCVGLFLGFGGVALLAGPLEVAGGDQVNLVGAGVLMVTSFCWALGSMYARRAPLPHSPLLATAMQMIVGGVLLYAAGGLSGEGLWIDLRQVSLLSLAAYLYLIVFGSLVGFTAYIWLLGVTTPAKVSTYAFVNPVIAVLLGWALGGETLTPRTVVASVVIVGSVALITARRARRESGTDKAQAWEGEEEKAEARVTLRATEPKGGGGPLDRRPWLRDNS